MIIPSGSLVPGGARAGQGAMACVQWRGPTLSLRSIGGPVGASFLLAGPPAVVGTARDAGAGPVRTLAPAAAIHAAQVAFRRRAQRCRLLQREPFDMLAGRPRAVAATGPQRRLARRRRHLGLPVAGEQAGHRDPREASPQLLRDPVRGLAVKEPHPFLPVGDRPACQALAAEYRGRAALNTRFRRWESCHPNPESQNAASMLTLGTKKTSLCVQTRLNQPHRNRARTVNGK